MKIAVYTIAKNEERFVQRWYDSAQDADSLHILDTGSTDGTISLAHDLGIDVARWEFDPWRFDKARNMALDLVPHGIDYCIALDMDEVLQPGWREHLEELHAQGVTRPRYRYVWSWENGRPGLVYGGDKIHTRAGYYWRHPVHEVLTSIREERQGWCGLEIHHHPDSSKSRSQYLPLLELAVAEDPDDDRNAHYLAREYFYAGRFDEAEAEFKRHLSLPSSQWPPERAASLRYLYKITGDREWLEWAEAESPDRRETLVELAQYYHDEGDWPLCLEYAMKALQIKERPLDYLCESFAWGATPHDLAAIACYRMGLYQEAKYRGNEALKLSPYDARLWGNMEFYERAAG